MSYTHILCAAGFSSSELSDGAMIVDTPIDGSELARLKTATGSIRMGHAVGAKLAERFGRVFSNWVAITP